MTPISLVGKFSFVALAGTLLLGCGTVSSAGPIEEEKDEVPARDESPAQTDSLVYHLVRGPAEYRVWVNATYHNTTGATVYFRRCTPGSTKPMFGGGRTGPDSTRRFFSDYAWASVGGVPTGSIANGESVTISAPFGSLDQPNMQPPLHPEDIVGLMRINIALCKQYAADSDNCQPLPQRERQSNAFLVAY